MSGITFNDVLFEPQYSEVPSRSKIDVSSQLGPLKLKLPVISANMKDITGPEMVKAMHVDGGLGILHRFDNDSGMSNFKQSCELLDPSGKKNIFSYIGVSVGVQESDKQRFIDLLEAGAKTFCIDIAHGHHKKMKDMLHFMNKSINGVYLTQSNKVVNREDVLIIAGNVATDIGAQDLFSWGANVVKVGIGPGSCCQTRNNTGVGVPQLHALKEIREACGKDALIISDGGLKTSGDVAKALKYANAVMVASMISGTTETPGHVYENEKGQFYKVLGGSASGERKVQNGGKKTFVEGMVKEVPFRGKVKFILRNIHQCLQSSFSYSGAFNLKEFQEKAVLKPISGGTKSESKLQ